MKITQKQFVDAKQNLDLELTEEDKYIERWVDGSGGVLYYRKPGETYMAYGSIADYIESPNKNSDKGLDSLEDLKDKGIDSLEKLQQMVWDVIGERVAVESSCSYTLSHPYKGYRRLILKKMPTKIEVYAIEDFSNQDHPDPLHVSYEDEFEDVLEELNYNVR